MQLRCLGLIALVLATRPVLVAAAQSHAHWGYDGKDGPRAWATLSPEYAECGRGSRQSPIDLPVAAGPDAPRAPAADMRVYHHEHALDVSNNGHTVAVAYDDGDQLALGETVYPLVQYHFHTPSEHTFAGQHFPGEIHLVHRAANGQLAVVGSRLGHPPKSVSKGK
jgi:carbonic anhydrase